MNSVADPTSPLPRVPVRLLTPGRLGLGAAVLLGMLAQAGCRDGKATGAPDGASAEQHVGHVIPAHKPRDFPSAVRRLRELNLTIDRVLADANDQSLKSGKTLPITLDIATWLPEIAADSDMPEGVWNDVEGCSEALVRYYWALTDAVAASGRPPANQIDPKVAEREIARLEAILTKSDPRWFNEAKGGLAGH